MFDFSFAEIATIGAVALVVIGPERLPKVARTIGHLMGRAQRYVNNVKADIQREVELEEFRKIKDSVNEAAGEVRASLQDTQNTIRNAGQSLQAEIDDAVAETKKRIVDPNAPVAEPALETATTTSPQAPSSAPPSHTTIAHEAAPDATAATAQHPPQAQAELPLSDAAADAPAASAAQPETLAKPPVNATTGMPT